MPTPAADEFKLPPTLELDQIITLQEAKKVSSLSPDSWKRNHPDKIVELSPGRLGIRLRHALMLAKPGAGILFFHPWALKSVFNVAAA